MEKRGGASGHTEEEILGERQGLGTVQVGDPTLRPGYAGIQEESVEQNE